MAINKHSIGVTMAELREEVPVFFSSGARKFFGTTRYRLRRSERDGVLAELVVTNTDPRTKQPRYVIHEVYRAEESGKLVIMVKHEDESGKARPA